MNNMFKKYYPNFIPISETAKSSFLFINGDEFFDPAGALPPNFVHIGGIGMKTPKPLSQVRVLFYLLVTV